MENFDNNLDTVFSAISDPTRRGILSQLKLGEASINQVAEPYNMSQPAISKHIRVLENAGLIKRRKQGTSYLLTLNAVPLEEASDWFEEYKQYWTVKLDQLENFLMQTEKE